MVRLTESRSLPVRATLLATLESSTTRGVPKYAYRIVLMSMSLLLLLGLTGVTAAVEEHLSDSWTEEDVLNAGERSAGDSFGESPSSRPGAPMRGAGELR